MLFLPKRFNTKGMRISNQYKVEHIIVSFFQRNQIFTYQEEQRLKKAGVISFYGDCEGYPYNYSVHLKGENHLFRNKDNLRLFMKNRTMELRTLKR